jgi:rRNA maturation endonuclease Nob1
MASETAHLYVQETFEMFNQTDTHGECPECGSPLEIQRS